MTSAARILKVQRKQLAKQQSHHYWELAQHWSRLVILILMMITNRQTTTHERKETLLDVYALTLGSL